jgi:hypothetical protein
MCDSPVGLFRRWDEKRCEVFVDAGEGAIIGNVDVVEVGALQALCDFIAEVFVAMFL